MARIYRTILAPCFYFFSLLNFASPPSHFLSQPLLGLYCFSLLTASLLPLPILLSFPFSLPPTARLLSQPLIWLFCISHPIFSPLFCSAPSPRGSPFIPTVNLVILSPPPTVPYSSGLPFIPTVRLAVVSGLLLIPTGGMTGFVTGGKL